MNINVHIERLILEGLPVKGSEGPAVQAAVEGELARLLAERGLDGLAGGAVPSLSAGSIELAGGARPAHLGRQIARAIHGGIGPGRKIRQPQPAQGGKAK
jgi:hypothetical protein